MRAIPGLALLLAAAAAAACAPGRPVRGPREPNAALSASRASRAASSAPSSAPSHVRHDRATDLRNALITLAALQAAAAIESTAEDRKRFVHMGIFAIVEKPDHPLRGEVIAHVRAWPHERGARALAFFRAHPAYSTLYHAFVVESFDPPPTFAPRARAPSTIHNAPALPPARAELAALLREAWTAGGVERLATSVAPAWDALQFAPSVSAARKAAVLDYLSFERPETLPPFTVLYDPLLREMNGYGSEPTDGEVLLIVGPSGDVKERELVLIHEFTHLPLTRILDRADVRAAIERASCADASIGDHKSYDGFANYLMETLVRAISYRLAGAPSRNSGFLFEPFFAEVLPRYEALAHRDFAVFARDMFEELARRYCSP